MTAIDPRVEDANRGDIRARPDDALSETLYPCVLLAFDVVDVKGWTVVGEPQLRNGIGRKHHEFDSRPAGDNGNDHDLREKHPAVTIGHAHAQTRASVLNLRLAVPVTPQRPPHERLRVGRDRLLISPARRD